LKKIEAFIRAEKLDAVIDALERTGYPGITISEVRGHGKQRGSANEWHGQYQSHTFQPKIRLEVIIHDKDVNRILNAVAEAAKGGEFGAGKIFVSDISDALRIRTGQRGDIALD
jgi:nitrogen regulatory protein P-II 1